MVLHLHYAVICLRAPVFSNHFVCGTTSAKTRCMNKTSLLPLNRVVRAWMCGVLAVALLGGCAGNRVERSTGEMIDDNATTLRVKNALSKDPVYKYPDVTVTTFKGTVQLGGFVESDGQKRKAEDMIRQVEGVKQVKNAISLKQ
jgi:hyperosmotically inducible protein